jgi:hypothetical protein
MAPNQVTNAIKEKEFRIDIPPFAPKPLPTCKCHFVGK